MQKLSFDPEVVRTIAADAEKKVVATVAKSAASASAVVLAGIDGSKRFRDTALQKGLTSAEAADLRLLVAAQMHKDAADHPVEALGGDAGALKEAESILRANRQIQERYDKILGLLEVIRHRPQHDPNARLYATRPEKSGSSVPVERAEALRAVIAAHAREAIPLAIDRAHDLWFQHEVVVGNKFTIDAPSNTAPNGRVFAHPSWINRALGGAALQKMIDNNEAGCRNAFAAMVRSAAGERPVTGRFESPRAYFEASVERAAADPLSGPKDEPTREAREYLKSALVNTVLECSKLLDHSLSWDRASEDVRRLAGWMHDAWSVRNEGRLAAPDAKETFVPFDQLSAFAKEQDLPPLMFTIISLLETMGAMKAAQPPEIALLRAEGEHAVHAHALERLKAIKDNVSRIAVELQKRASRD